jgi:hypothetical protein
MDGTDLSPLLSGKALPHRPYSYGGYSDSFYIRSDGWAMFGENSGRGLRLFDLPQDPGERRDAAGAHPGKVGELFGEVLRRLGGRLPYYGKDQGDAPR